MPASSFEEGADKDDQAEDEVKEEGGGDHSEAVKGLKVLIKRG